MQVPIDPDKNFLHQILRLLPVTDRSIYEIQQAGLISVDQLRKSPLLATKKRSYDRRVVHRAQLLANTRPLWMCCLLTKYACHYLPPKSFPLVLSCRGYARREHCVNPYKSSTYVTSPLWTVPLFPSHCPVWWTLSLL